MALLTYKFITGNDEIDDYFRNIEIFRAKLDLSGPILLGLAPPPQSRKARVANDLFWAPRPKMTYSMGDHFRAQDPICLNITHISWNGWTPGRLMFGPSEGPFFAVFRNTDLLRYITNFHAKTLYQFAKFGRLCQARICWATIAHKKYSFKPDILYIETSGDLAFLRVLMADERARGYCRKYLSIDKFGQNCTEEAIIWAINNWAGSYSQNLMFDAARKGYLEVLKLLKPERELDKIKLPGPQLGQAIYQS